MIIRLRNGARYKIRSGKTSPGDAYIVNETWLYGVHNGIKDAVKKASVGIDIGAHIGVFSVFAARQNPGLKIYAYEPAEDNFKLLQENIALNKLEGRIVPVQAAVVGRDTGRRKLYLTGKEHGLYTIDEDQLEAIKNYNMRGEVGSVEVEALPLAGIFDANNIERCDFIKMDCEGSEYEILFNTPADLLKRVGAMSIEYHPGHDAKDLKAYLEKIGFAVTFPHRRLEVLLAIRH